MSIPSTTSTTTTLSATATATAASSGPGQVDPNMFLKLLASTIKNQDPTHPTDPSQMLQQLASMSQVQQSALTNVKLASLLETTSIGQSAALVGRQVTSADGEDLGRVDAVRYAGDRMVALMHNGQEVVLGPGVTIRS